MKHIGYATLPVGYPYSYNTCYLEALHIKLEWLCIG